MSRRTGTTEFLKDCMADALIKLLSEKELSKITVREIVELSGVGRTTWFRCFPSKYEAIVYRIVRLWSKWAEHNGLLPTDLGTSAAAAEFFGCCRSLRALFNVLYGAGLKPAVYDAMVRFIVPADGNEAQRLNGMFLAGGLFGVLDELIRGGFASVPEAAADAVSDFLRESTDLI